MVLYRCDDCGALATDLATSGFAHPGTRLLCEGCARKPTEPTCPQPTVRAVVAPLRKHGHTSAG